MKKIQVLCVDDKNTILSVMLATLLAEAIGPRFQVKSAGSDKTACDGERASEFTQMLLQDCEPSITAHRSRWIGDMNLSRYLFIICDDEVSEDWVRSRPTDNDVQIWVIANDSTRVLSPQAGSLKEHRECLALLKTEIHRIADWILITS